MEITNRIGRQRSEGTLEGVVEAISINYTVGGRNTAYVHEIRIGDTSSESGKILYRYILLTNSVNITPAEIAVGDMIKIQGATVTEEIGRIYKISKPEAVENLTTGIKYG
jgi:hypothetical protein